MSTPDTDEIQRKIKKPQAIDNAPTAITHIQAMKCAAIIGAILDGHDGFKEVGGTVIKFLQAAAIEANGGEPMHPTSRESWSIIDAAVWPRSGRPRPQPDVD
jgi:hypothetical protein